MVSDPIAAVSHPKALVFDWDNTLVETWGTIHAALTETFVAMDHVPWTLEETKSRTRHAMREAFPKLFGDRWEEAAKVFYDAFARLHIEQLSPAQGAHDMLDFLDRRGLPLCVVSNKTGPYLRAEAEHLGWDRFFHRLVGAGDAPHDKPAEDPVHVALDGTDIVAGADVWFVGDTGIDMEIAHKTGCIPVLLRADDGSEEEFEEFQPKVKFRSCIELASCVRSL